MALEEKLKEKIEHEYRCFFLDQMRTSKENIFARSGEIAAKKKLRRALLALAAEVDEPAAELLIVHGNLLESAFRFAQDEQGGTDAAADEARETVRRWLDSVRSGPDKI